MCFAPQRRALFRQRDFQKCSDAEVSQMCFAPQRRALFRHLNFQSARNLRCFVHFDFQMCFAPQRRALVRNLIWPHGSAPAALASLFSTLRGHKSLEKHRLSRLFSSLLFSSLLLSSPLLSSLLFSSLLWLFPPLLFHLHILSEVWLLNFLR